MWDREIADLLQEFPAPWRWEMQRNETGEVMSDEPQIFDAENRYVMDTRDVYVTSSAQKIGLAELIVNGVNRAATGGN